MTAIHEPCRTRGCAALLDPTTIDEPCDDGSRLTGWYWPEGREDAPDVPDHDHEPQPDFMSRTSHPVGSSSRVRLCTSRTPEPHERGEFPMSCYSCHMVADA